MEWPHAKRRKYRTACSNRKCALYCVHRYVNFAEREPAENAQRATICDFYEAAKAVACACQRASGCGDDCSPGLPRHSHYLASQAVPCHWLGPEPVVCFADGALAHTRVSDRSRCGSDRLYPAVLAAGLAP